MNKFVLDVGAIRQNVEIIKKGLNQDTKFCAMVKANAYGHNLKLVAKHIQDIVDYFGVACVREALILRNNNIAKPILVVGAYDKTSCSSAIQNDIIQTVCSLEDLISIEYIAKKYGIVSKVHIKINTGMNRIGVRELTVFKKMLDFFDSTNYVKLVGVFSHFSCSDSDKNFTIKQNRIFRKYIKYIKDDRVIKHISSSYASINYPKYNYDMVRVGIAMYGYSKNAELTPAITICSNIKAISTLPKSQPVGYNATYVTKKQTKIATVCLGYADGINLKVSNKLNVRINGKLCPVIGKICMDMFMCDVTNVDAKLNDTVCVFDKINNAYVWSEMCKTSEYEVLTNFKTNRMKVVVKK